MSVENQLLHFPPAEMREGNGDFPARLVRAYMDPEDWYIHGAGMSTMSNTFYSLMAFVGLPEELTREAIAEVLLGNDDLTSRLCLDYPNLILHGVVEHDCSLEVVQFVHQHCPQAIKLRDADGNLPLHVAIVHNPFLILSWDVLAYLIQEYPAALLEPLKFNGRLRLPLHMVLERSCPCCQVLTEDNLDTLLHRGYESTIAGDFGDHAFSESFAFHCHVLAKPHGSGRFAFYFALRQCRVFMQARGLAKYRTKWIHWFLLYYFRKETANAGDFDAQACRYACDTLLMPMGDSSETVLHRIIAGQVSMPPDVVQDVRFQECFHRFTKPPYRLDLLMIDANGNLPLHSVQTLSHELLTLVVQAFPGILSRRNLQGLVPFASNCFPFIRSASPKELVNKLFLLLRADPQAILDINLQALRDAKKPLGRLEANVMPSKASSEKDTADMELAKKMLVL